MKIRKATKKDVQACLKIQKLDGDKIWKPKNFEQSVKKKDVIFLVAEGDKNIVGYVLGYVDPCIDGDVLIHEVRVNRKMRNKGIGTKIINEFCRVCFKRGIKDILALIQPAHLRFYKDSCKFKQGVKWIEVSKVK